MNAWKQYKFVVLLTLLAGSILGVEKAHARRYASSPMVSVTQAGDFTYNPSQGHHKVEFRANWKLPALDRGAIKFRAKVASHDIHVIFSPELRIVPGQGYQFIIGGWDNTNTVIRRSYEDDNTRLLTVTRDENPEAMTQRGKWETYWISIDEGILLLGRGDNVGDNIVVACADPNPHKGLMYFGLSGWDNPVEYADIQIMPLGEEYVQASPVSGSTSFTYRPAEASRWNEATFRPEWTMQETDKGSIVFRAKTSNDVIVQMSTQLSANENNAYTVVIGGGGNTKAFLRRGTNGGTRRTITKEENPDAMVVANTWQDYWVSYEDGLLAFGRGRLVGENTQGLWHDPKPLTGIKYFGLSGWDKAVEYENIAIAGPMPSGEPQMTKPVTSGDSVNYGDTVRITTHQQFDGNNLQLHTWGVPFTHAGTSGQFQVSAWQHENDSDLFKIMGPDGSSDDYKLGQPVKADDIIRLNQIDAGHNLHSHNTHQSPGNHGFEVTLYQHGKDSNDNWQLMLDGQGAGSVWNKDARFMLKHVNSQATLYVPGPKYDVRKGTGFPGTDYQHIVATKIGAPTQLSKFFVKEITKKAPVAQQTEDVAKPVTIVKGPDGHEWGLGAKKVPGGSITMCKKDDKWMEVDGGLVQLSVGPKGILWGVNENDDIFYRDGINSDNPEGTGWSQVQGKLKEVYITPFGSTVYGKNKANEFFVSASGNPKNPAWEKQDQDDTQVTYAPNIQGMNTKVYDTDWALPEKNKGSITFAAQTVKDVHINLARSAVDEPGKMYEIIIGGWNNTQSVIKDGPNNYLFKTKAIDAMVDSGMGKRDKPEWHGYWITIDGGKIAVGKGDKLGENVIMETDDNSPHKNIRYVGFGGWDEVVKFREIKIVGPQKPEEKEVVEVKAEKKDLDKEFFALTRDNFYKQLIKNTQEKHTINYGDIIELNHVYGNIQIHANNAFKYNNTGGSGQVQVQGWPVPGDESNYFIVKGPDGQDDKTGPVKSGDTIRLEHKVSKMNLHSHASHQSPNKLGYEITLFGENGKGDSNDNWVVMLMDDDQFGNPARIGSEWTTRDSVNLFHANSSDNNQANTPTGKRFLAWGGPNQMFDVWTTNDKNSTKRHEQYELAGMPQESHWFVSGFHKDSPEKKEMSTAEPTKVTPDEKKEAEKEKEGDKKKEEEKVVEKPREQRRRRTRRRTEDKLSRRSRRDRGQRRERGSRSSRSARTRSSRRAR
ncbi:MAG: hypothetical protein H6679_00375 [Epsilonproteobacteria bacterium]|nr:hypothetical protein [Campylobacterota bacterium]